MANERTLVTLIQNEAGKIVAVRINGATIPVVNAGPTPALGQTNFVLTIGNVDMVYEPEKVPNG